MLEKANAFHSLLSKNTIIGELKLNTETSLHSIRQRALRFFWKPWPDKSGWVTKFAGLDSRFKNSTATRILQHLLSQSALQPWQTVYSNLGLRLPRLIEVPVFAGPYALFDRPGYMDDEKTSIEVCRTLAPLCDGFVDVGAHIGLFVFELLYGGERLPECPLYAIEPAKELNALLDRNLKTLGIKDAVTLESFAVGAEAGQVEFFFNRTHPSMSTINSEFGKVDERDRYVVPVRRLADYLESKKLDRALLKIDVEAAEVDVVKGLAREANRVRAMVFEVLPPSVEQGLHLWIGEQMGMSAVQIQNGRLVSGEIGKNYHPEYRNWLYFRNDDEALCEGLLSRLEWMPQT